MTDLSVVPTAGASAPESLIAVDLARRALIVGPCFVGVALAGWGVDGALSSLFALALVTGNFLLAARLSSYAAKISLAALMGAVLIGYPVRLALIALATLLVHDAGWFAPVPWGFTVVIAHLGLLVWEATRVSATPGFPVFKPKSKPARPAASGRRAPSIRSAKGSS
jgi:hypothetical protein